MSALAIGSKVTVVFGYVRPLRYICTPAVVIADKHNERRAGRFRVRVRVMLQDGTGAIHRDVDEEVERTCALSAEGSHWCRGHKGPAVDALKTVVMLGAAR